MRTSSTKCGNNLSPKLATRRNPKQPTRSHWNSETAKNPREKKRGKIRRRLVLLEVSEIQL
jgi:hypothetical protein